MLWNWVWLFIYIFSKDIWFNNFIFCMVSCLNNNLGQVSVKISLAFYYYTHYSLISHNISYIISNICTTGVYIHHEMFILFHPKLYQFMDTFTHSLSFSIKNQHF